MQKKTTGAFATEFISPLTLDKVFEWPPDVFALTSAILRASGAYRHYVSPPRGQEWPPELDGNLQGREWTDVTMQTADEWLDSIADLEPLRLPKWLERLKATLIEYSRVPIDDLRDVDSHPDAWPLCEAILCLHVLADSACRGFGTPAAPRRFCLIRFLADHLLTTCGSLSRLPKASGIVLPKMRTPQTGVTLRASSLFVTWHQTEVDAVWRSTPWVNAEENTLNVLVVPWPTELNPNAFKRNVHPVGKRSIGPNRYFSYAPAEPVDVDKIVTLVLASAPQVNRIHMLVLPELALTWTDLRELQLKLAEHLPPNQIPILVAGVRNWQPLASEKDAREDCCNSVVVSVCFADKWYDLRQNKHHRWKLDRRQVQQYRLAGVLASDRGWWEDVPIPPRHLSILAPTGWLALCPLICEDLAQLEPVSELIRGVGPTLLVALLLDGPQLPQRWSARYASVMADDPGTSVLTVTSLGMAARSKPLQLTPGEADRSAAPSRVTVALWRDSKTGFQELQIEPEDDALIVTLSADWHEEFSLDGRGDGGAAATFVLNSVQTVRVPAARSETPQAPPPRRDMLRADQTDLYELTTFVQLVDATLDATREDFVRILELARGEPNDPFDTFPVEVQEVVSLIQEAASQWRPTHRAERDFYAALEYFEDMWRRFPERVAPDFERTVSDVTNRTQRFGHIVRLALEDADKLAHEKHQVLRRTKRAVIDNVLWAVHNRLEQMRRKGTLNLEGANLGLRVQDSLARRHTFDSGA